MDFTKVVRALREFAASQAGNGANVTAEYATGVADALITAKREVSAQAFSALYDHLVQDEQFVAAARLAAFVVPNACNTDSRVATRVAHALETAKTMETPEIERAITFRMAAADIDLGTAVNLAQMQARAKYLASVVRLSRASVVIEYGCDGGLNTAQLALAHPHLQFIGLDGRPEVIERARKDAANVGNLKFEILPCARLYEAADVVGVLDCLEHTAHPDAMLEDAERYCRPGGYVVLSVPNGSWSLRTDNESNVGAGQHVAVTTPGTLTMQISQRGQIVDYDVLPGPVPWERNSSVVLTYEPRKSS